MDGSPGGKVDLKIFHKWLLYLMCSQASRSCGLLKKNLHIITKKVTFSGLNRKYGGMLFFVTLKTANWQTADFLNFSNIIKTSTTRKLKCIFSSSALINCCWCTKLFYNLSTATSIQLRYVCVQGGRGIEPEIILPPKF